MFDVLSLITQLKSFVKEEKGTPLSLLVMLSVAFFTSSAIFSSLSKTDLEVPFSRIFAFFAILVVVLWIKSRWLGISRRRTNIAIAHMEVSNVDPKDQLTSEQKIRISEEIMLFIYSSLQNQRQALNLKKYLDFSQLPRRIKVSYHNNDTVAYHLKTEVLIWGLLRYSGGKIWFTPKYEFSKSLNSELFQKLTRDIQSGSEVEYKLGEDENLGMRRIMHLVTYIGLIFHALKLQNQQKYAAAKELIDHAIESLDELYDSSDHSVERGDQEILLVESQLYYVKAKVLHNWAQAKLQNFDATNQAQDLLTEAGRALERKGDIIQKYFKSDLKSSATVLEHSYMYALSLMAEANDDDEIKKILAKLQKMKVDPSQIRFVKKLLSVRFKDKAHATKVYEEVLEEDPDNIVALRALGFELALSGNWRRAHHLLGQLEQMTTRHIFHDELYDTKLQLVLAQTALHRGRLDDLVKHLSRYGRFKAYNRRLLALKYIL
jgi:tetratricopeptide (TPR) repeat protein